MLDGDSIPLDAGRFTIYFSWGKIEMNITLVLRIVILLYASVFAVFFIKDCLAHKEEFGGGKIIPLMLIGFVTNCFDTLGIGSFATTQAGFKFTKSSPDETMPGTLNVGDCIPIVLEFVLFLGLIEVETLTLVLMIAAATVGSVIGASIVSKWPVRMVRYALGGALLFLAAMMACKVLAIGPFGIVGTATGLSGVKLAAGVLINFLLGALMTIGIGLYTPCIALCGALGLNVKVAFPVMMGSCAFLMPACGLKFIKEGKYDRKASVALTISGMIGVLAAFFVVKELPLTALTWIIIAVMLYTSVTFFRDAAKTKPERNTGSVKECAAQD